MRTANEMREFAARYNASGEGLSAAKLERCPFETIEQTLLPEERVLFCFGALYEKAVALTNYRLLHAETKEPAHDQMGGLKAVNYDVITSVFSGNTLLHISLYGQDDLIYGNFAMERIREAAENVGDVIQKYKSSVDPRTAALLTPADELKKFKELLDMGAISEEEFEAKKKQLLAL